MNSIELMEAKGFELGGIDVGRERFFFIIWLDRTSQLCERLGKEFKVSEERAVIEYVEKMGYEEEYPTLDDKVKKLIKSEAVRHANGAFLAHWYHENDSIVIFDENDMDNHFTLDGDEKGLFKKAVYEAYLSKYCDLVSK